MIKEKNENNDSILELNENDIEKVICKQLLNPISLDNTLFVYEHFKKGWFKNKTIEIIFNFLHAYYKKYEKIPKRADLESVFQNDCYTSNYANIKPMLDSLYEFEEHKFSEQFISDNIVKFTKARGIYFAILDNISAIEEDGDISGCLHQFESIVRMELSNDIGVNYFNQLEQHIEKLVEPTSKIPTGFKDLDKVFYGGLPKDDICLFVPMAQPGLGKSQFIGNIAYYSLLNNKKVLIVSLEMSEQMYSMRISALMSGTNINQLKDSVDKLRRSVQGIKQLHPNADLYIKEYPTGTCTAASLKQLIRKLKETKNFDPDIIIVDYLGIMRPNGNPSGLSLYEKGCRCAEELRALSCELKRPIIAPIQVGRRNGGYAKEDIDIDSASESSAIIATADVIIALFQTPEERLENKINLKILKNRLGGYIGAIIPIKVNYETLRMSDWNDDLDKSPEQIKKEEIREQNLEKLNKNVSDSDESTQKLDNIIGDLANL